MNIAVAGLWHLGCVTAACLAEAGFDVTGIDRDAGVVDALYKGRPPIAEPGLPELIAQGIAGGRLRFATDPAAAAAAELVFVCYDTPVDADDRADTAFVLAETERFFPYLADGMVLVVSSQLPIGSVAELERRFADRFPGKHLEMASVPENLRLGKALDVFRRPDRIVAGVRSVAAQEVLAAALGRFTDNILWMSVESAEMVKHSINAFLALSVTYINELAGLCELYGADAFDVERGLKSDARIGPRAYLRPGPAFAGGTLARDVAYLSTMGRDKGLPMPLINAIGPSNAAHAGWAKRRLTQLFDGLAGLRVAVLGLTYKPGTDTLRRSESVTTCHWLAEQGATVAAFDPAVTGPRPELPAGLLLTDSPETALRRAQAAVILTGWEAITTLAPKTFTSAMDDPCILDPGRLAPQLAGVPGIRYFTVGKSA